MSQQRDIAAPKDRQAIDALRGYAYQLYQSAIAWTELRGSELLYLEVAEDYAVSARDALQAVQVKDTTAKATINSDGVVKAIDSLVSLTAENPTLDVSVRYLTTAPIGLERSSKHRVSGRPALQSWRKLAVSGNTTELRRVLENSKISRESKDHFRTLTEDQFRRQVLRKLHFDCGAPELDLLRHVLQSRLLELVAELGGSHAHMTRCEQAVLNRILSLCASNENRLLSRSQLSEEVEAATRVYLSQAALDQHMAAIAASHPSGTGVSTVQASASSLTLHELPSMPSQYVERPTLIEALQNLVQEYGFGWLHGATGMGKTLLAREYAQIAGGRWLSLNLRGMEQGQSSHILGMAADALNSAEAEGIIADDVDLPNNQTDLDSLHRFVFAAGRLSIPLIFTSYQAAPQQVRFLLDVKEDVSLRVPDFGEAEIRMLVEKAGGQPDRWTRYVYTCSGAGHPQLSQALIANLQHRGWPTEELRTLTALVKGNPAVDEVRTSSRLRLLHELQPEARALLERLSLYVGRFTRSLVVNLAAVSPSIADAGLLLDELVGPWIDRADRDHFQLSPLLSGLAPQTLPEDEQKAVQYAIADTLTRGPQLDASKMNAAIVAALASQNEAAATRFCMAILGTKHRDVEAVAAAADLICLMHKNAPIWPANAVLNQMFRGVQLLLHHNGPSGRSGFNVLLKRFRTESADLEEPTIAAGMELIVYSKLLAVTPSPHAVPNFMPLVQRIQEIVETAEVQSQLAPIEYNAFGDDSKPSIAGLALFMQVGKLEKIDDLVGVFEFLDNATPELRTSLLQPLSLSEFDPNMLVQGAWLAEHTANTIEAGHHSSVFDRLERMAASWGQPEIAVSCLKFHAIILDEYGEKSEEALAILDAGISRYRGHNAELKRAKSKVLRRAHDHVASLALADSLIEEKALSNHVDIAFLARDAAISAEKLGKFEKARQYFLHARSAAEQVDLPDMHAMATGLLGDAALAAWHAKDATSCLTDLTGLLNEIDRLDARSSLRAAHVKAASNHILLWLAQNVSGERQTLKDGKPAQIFPGCVSNPEPHPDIGEHPRVPIDLSWYMLALIECYSDVDVGVVTNLDNLLPSGRVREGELLLTVPLMSRAMRELNAVGFLEALSTHLSQYAFALSRDKQSKPFDVQNLTYGAYPNLTHEQGLQAQGIAQPAVLTFYAVCLLNKNTVVFDDFTKLLEKSGNIITDPMFISSLKKGDNGKEGYGIYASALGRERQRIESDGALDPTNQCYLVINFIQTASNADLLASVADIVLRSYREGWRQVIQNQRFMMSNPSLYVEEIDILLGKDDGDPIANLLELALTTLPATKLGSQSVARSILEEVGAKHAASKMEK